MHSELKSPCDGDTHLLELHIGLQSMIEIPDITVIDGFFLAVKTDKSKIFEKHFTRIDSNRIDSSLEEKGSLKTGLSCEKSIVYK